MMTKSEYIKLRIAELTARKEAAEDYSMNATMQIEATLLKAQIEVLMNCYFEIENEIEFDEYTAQAYMG